MKHKQSISKKQRGYTLIETLVASSVMMVAIGAASSLSLAMITQEEMSERTVRAVNYLENSAQLYQLGFDQTEISELLPNEPSVTSVAYAAQTGQNVGGLGAVDLMQLTLTYKPSAASSANAASTKSWTGGDNTKQRTHSVVLFRSQP